MQSQTLNLTLPPPTHTHAAQPLHNFASFCRGTRFGAMTTFDWWKTWLAASACLTLQQVKKLSSSQLQLLPHRDPTSSPEKDPNKLGLLSLLPDSLTKQCQHIALPQSDYSQLECISSDAWWQQRQHLRDVYSFTNVYRFQEVQRPVAGRCRLAAISSL